MTMLPEHLAGLEALQARLTARPAVEPGPQPVACRKVTVGYPGEQIEIEVVLPSADAVRTAIQSAELQAVLEARPALGQSSAQQETGKSTASLIRERAAEEQAALEAFVRCMADHFSCPGLAADHVRVKMRGPFLALRAMAHRLSAEAARQAADPTRPGRG